MIRDTDPGRLAALEPKLKRAIREYITRSFRKNFEPVNEMTPELLALLVRMEQPKSVDVE